MTSGETPEAERGRCVKRWLLLAVSLFFLTVVLFTRLDFLVNKSLYDYGLKFDEGWYVEYSLL